MLKFVCKCTLIIVLTCNLYAKFAHAETVIIAAENDWIPYAKHDGTGLANEIVIAAFKSVDIDVKYEIFPYARVLLNIEAGTHIAGFNVPLDEQSNRKYILGKEKLFDAVSAYYANRTLPLLAKNRTELTPGITIGVVRGYGYGDHYLEMVNKGIIKEAISDSETSNLKKLANGRINGTIIYNKTANILINKLGLDSVIEFAFINETTPIHLAFSRAHPKGLYYSDKFDEGMRRIKSNGIYQAIYDSY